jgi:hypothetical protein
MHFAYIAINVRNFNSKADFRENATSLNIKHRFKKLNILHLVIYMVHDYSFFGSTADFVIKKEHLGFLPALAISKGQRRRVEI